MKKTMYKNEKVRQVTFYNKYLSDIAKNNGYFRGNHDFVLKRDDGMNPRELEYYDEQ